METKKQIRWFKTDVDFENSFKYWFALMWQNKFIQLFIATFTGTVLEALNFNWVLETIYENFALGGNFGGIATILGLSILPISASTIAYKGFWQYFNDMKNGRSR